jgi:hypothetical protein
MDLGYDRVYALRNKTFQDLSRAGGPIRVIEDTVAMFCDCGVD